MTVKLYPVKPQAKSQTNKKSSEKSSLICDFCHMSGHLKEKCYCIHGYPSWHRFFGKPKPKPKNVMPRNSVVANVTQVPADSVSDNTSTGMTLSAGVQCPSLTATSAMNMSDSQCQQLIQMLQQSLTNSKSTSNAYINADWISNHSANTVQMSGNIHVVPKVHSVIHKSTQCHWIIDTGATDHITPFLSFLQMLNHVQPLFRYQMEQLLISLMLAVSNSILI